MREKAQTNDKLTEKLIQAESDLTSLRVRADEAQVSVNGLVCHHVEDLTIDLNSQSTVDKAPLQVAKGKKAEL